MRKKQYARAIVLLLIALTWTLAEGEEAAKRESVLDKVEYVEPDLVELPAVARLCDELKLDKRKVDIGGCNLYCEVEGNGTPLVLINGGPGGTHHVFHPSFSHAAEWAQVIYYDQRGCGLSDYAPGDGYSLDQAVRDLDALRHALGVEKWVVLGHSYGGSLAQCYALKHPERVLGLVLVCSAEEGHEIATGDTRQYQFITNAESERMDQVRAEKSVSSETRIFNVHLNGDWKRQNFYRPTREQLARMALYEWKHDERFRREIIPTLRSVHLQGLFEGSPFPILVMESKWDLTWGAEKAANFHGCFPGSQLVMFEMAGHSPFEDAPDEFFPALKAFVCVLNAPPDAVVADWKAAVAKKVAVEEAKPERILRTALYGRVSSDKIAGMYNSEWLGALNDGGLLLRLGFALYDAKKYEAALGAFEKMGKVTTSDRVDQAIACVWQGHMLDLLGKHEQAKAVYAKLADMNVNTQIRHDQYGIAYKPVSYGKYRIDHPFERVENKDKN